MKIEEQLKELKELDAKHQIIKEEKQGDIDKVLTEEIKEKLADIDDFYTSDLIIAAHQISNLEAEIKAAVVTNGESVKGVYTASYVKGRVSWDAKALNGYAAAHPEIESFRKVGNPSARIKRS